MVLAASSAVVAPLLLYVLLPLVASTQPLQVDAMKIVFTLLVTQLAPLGLGLAVRYARPSLAEKLLRPANLLCSILTLATLALVLVVYAPLLAEIRLRAYLAMTLLLAASFIAGWIFGGPGKEQRKALMLTTSLRNVGVGLVIVTGTFSETAAVTAVVVYGIFEILGSLAVAMALGISGRTSVEHYTGCDNLKVIP